MLRNEIARLVHVCPGISIHAMDIVQSPGMGIPPSADIDVHQTIVIAAVIAKSSAETAKKIRWEIGSDRIPHFVIYRTASYDTTKHELLIFAVLGVIAVH